MVQNRKIGLAFLALILLVGVILGVEALRRRRAAQRRSGLAPGAVPIYVSGEMVGSFAPEDLEALEEVQFEDQEEGKTQQGWLLADVLLAEIGPDKLTVDTEITVSSSSRGKSITLSWAEVSQRDHMVMFDLSGRGTLKLVSRLDKLDTREEWIQDTDKIEVNSP